MTVTLSVSFLFARYVGVCLCPIWVLGDEVRRLDDGEIDDGRRDAPLVVPCFHSIENALRDGGHDKGSKSRARMRDIEQVCHRKFFNHADDSGTLQRSSLALDRSPSSLNTCNYNKICSPVVRQLCRSKESPFKEAGH